jgi:hypothetical protein
LHGKALVFFFSDLVDLRKGRMEFKGEERELTSAENNHWRNWEAS